MQSPLVKLLIGSLGKDANGVPTIVALAGLMRQIDEGVKDAEWPHAKRSLLMKRIADAAADRQQQVDMEPR